MSILHTLQRDSLTEGGFAGLREHQLVKHPMVFGVAANNDGSWPGLGRFVYLADARFMPHGETRMHDHHKVDVISVIVKGHIEHKGSLGHGQDLQANDIQVQRAGGEGFSHNEVNPDNDWNRMLQLWVLPEQSGQAASYRVYQAKPGEMVRIYGGEADTDFPAQTVIDAGLLKAGQTIITPGEFLVYIATGRGRVDNHELKEGDMIRGNDLNFTALKDVMLVQAHHLS